MVYVKNQVIFYRKINLNFGHRLFWAVNFVAILFRAAKALREKLFDILGVSG